MECEPQTKNNKQVKLDDEEAASTLTKKVQRTLQVVSRLWKSVDFFAQGLLFLITIKNVLVFM